MLDVRSAEAVELPGKPVGGSAVLRSDGENFMVNRPGWRSL